MMSLTVMENQSAVPPPSYQRAQAKQRPALHINALALVTSLHLLMFCRLAVRLAHRLCPPPLPAGPGGSPRTYSEESLLLISLLRTLWRLSSQDMHDWLKSWPALAEAVGLPWKEGQLCIPSKSQMCKRRHAAGAPLHESLFVLVVLQALRRRLIGARDLIIDSAPILAWRRRDPDATFGHAPSECIPFLSCEASGCIPSCVVVLASLSSFSFLLPTHTMLLLPNACSRGPSASTKSIHVSSVWMLLTGVCASWPGFMLSLVPLPSFLGTPRTRRNAPVYLLHGPKKTEASGVVSNASDGTCVSLFSSSAPPLVWLV